MRGSWMTTPLPRPNPSSQSYLHSCVVMCLLTVCLFLADSPALPALTCIKPIIAANRKPYDALPPIVSKAQCVSTPRSPRPPIMMCPVTPRQDKPARATIRATTRSRTCCLPGSLARAQTQVQALPHAAARVGRRQGVQATTVECHRN